MSYFLYISHYVYLYISISIYIYLSISLLLIIPSFFVLCPTRTVEGVGV